MLVEVKNDLFNIAERLRSIDECYRVAFNTRLKRFEVHAVESAEGIARRGETLAVVVPFNRLDARTVTHVLKTRAERREEILREIEAHNEKLERDNRKKSLEAQLAKVL